MLRRVRRIVQGTSLLLFLVLLVLTRYEGQDELGWPVRLFLDIDPLVTITTLLSAHALPAAFLGGFLVLALGLVVGKAFCGWICPLGAIHQLAGRWGKRRPAHERRVRLYSPAQRWKYGMLAGVLAAAALGFHAAGFLDPISLSIRSLGLAIGPAAELALRGLFDALYHTESESVRAVSEPLYNLFRNNVLSFEQPSFRQADLLGLLFVGIVALNLVRPRFWCRFLCPLGALLGVVARYGTLRLDGGECTGCNLCTLRCPAGASPEEAASGGWRPAECFVCGTCTATCEQGLAFGWARPHPLPGSPPIEGVDAGRRVVLVGAAAGIVAAPLARLPGLDRPAPPDRIRPPGALPEPDFLARCIRCGECMKVCLTNGLHPAGLEYGLEAAWTPILEPRRGYCEYDCTLCGQVCPTGALRPLSVEEKREVVIGIAFVDPSRCLPLAFGTPCIVCEEHCPTEPKAIQLAALEVRLPDGEVAQVDRPVVDVDRCVGCGLCEARCPVVDLPAIRVSSIGETRDPDNRFLLSDGIYEG
ncbi:MAG: 4Fe-4S binding protein [Deltaproteobacteria bacterium]|nr:4Fe-4S binding protein [Deltaproteobacteria bacterium]